MAFTFYNPNSPNPPGSQSSPSTDPSTPADASSVSPELAPRAGIPPDSLAPAPQWNPARAVRYTLREAAALTGRSVTTLRRYIRCGKLVADKTPGRFGPEFLLDEPSILSAGFEIIERTSQGFTALDGVSHGQRSAQSGNPGNGSEVTRSSERGQDHPHDTLPERRSHEAQVPVRDMHAQVRSLEKILLEYVPASLYREISGKHEQLLIQYGMLRASGERLFEFRDEADRRSEELKRSSEQMKELQDRYAKEISFLKRNQRELELLLEEKNAECGTLREKIRVLELMNRNAVTNESIEKQFQRVYEKERELEALVSPAGPTPPEPPRRATLPPPTSPLTSPQDTGPVASEFPALDRWLDAGRKPPVDPDKLDH